jgi:cytochrome b pre-mRNA-processing protein 3
MVMSFLRRALGAKQAPAGVADLYDALVAQSRQSAFYEYYDVYDTLDGRFDLLALHAALVMRRLKGQGEAAQAFNQALFDHMFADMDASLREMGVSDLRVGKKVKEMAKAFYGRTVAYTQALDRGDRPALAEALARNLYRGDPPESDVVAQLADYVWAVADRLDEQPARDLMAGRMSLPEPKPHATAGLV